MRRVTNAKKAFVIPRPQMIHFHAEQLHIIPLRDLACAVGQKRCAAGNFLAKRRQPALLSFLERTFADDVSALPIITPVNQDHKLSGGGVTKSLRRIIRLLCEAKPQDVNGRAQVNQLEPGAFAHRRTPAIRRHH